MKLIAVYALLISTFIIVTVAEPFSAQDVDAENEGRHARSLTRPYGGPSYPPRPSPTFPRPPNEHRIKRSLQPNSPFHRPIVYRPSPTIPRYPEGNSRRY